jgi:hypothetical protein
MKRRQRPASRVRTPAAAAVITTDLSTWVQPITTVVSSLAGFALVVYALGGTVMWVRFEKVGLLADQAVAALSRSQLMTVGLRLMVVPALVSLALTTVLVGIGRSERRVWRSLGAVGFVAAALAVPYAWASATWAALVVVVAYAWRQGARLCAASGRPAYAKLGIVAILAAAVISLGRQVDEPVQ